MRASLKIDAAAALKLPGVIGVLTAADMPGLKTIPMRTGVIPGLERSQQTPIATTKVRYVGDPVAVVVAENRYIAEDALELIEVEYACAGRGHRRAREHATGRAATSRRDAEQHRRQLSSQRRRRRRRFPRHAI